MRNNQPNQTSQPNQVNNVVSNSMFPSNGIVTGQLPPQQANGMGQQQSGMPLSSYGANTPPQAMPQYYQQNVQYDMPQYGVPQAGRPNVMPNAPLYNDVYGTYNQQDNTNTTKKNDPQLSVRNLLIGGLITFALILVIFAVIVVPPLMRPSNKSYNESAQSIESISSVINSTDPASILKGFNEFQKNITDEQFTQSRNELTTFRNSLNTAVVSAQGSLAIKKDANANKQLTDIVSKYQAFDQDLSVISNVYDALSPVLSNIRSFNATIAQPAADDKVINKLNNDTDTIANKFSGFNTSDHDVDLAFNQAAQAYKDVASAAKKRFAKAPDAADAMNVADNNMKKFDLQKRGMIEKLVKHRTDFSKALRDLSGYLEDKAGH